MSDTDDEGAFESADEGESSTPHHKSKKESKVKTPQPSDKVAEESKPPVKDPEPEQEPSTEVEEGITYKVQKLEVSTEKESTPEAESPVQTEPSTTADPVVTQSPQAAAIERGNTPEEEKKMSVLEKLSSAATEQV